VSLGLATVAAIAIVLLFAAALWAAALFWAYRDIRQRTSDRVMTAICLLVMALFFVPGLVLYVLIRPPKKLAVAQVQVTREQALRQALAGMPHCPGCERDVEEEYVACPWCGHRLKEECAHCSLPLPVSFVACPYCLADRESEPFRPRTRAPV
jgi:hypothetical protein